MRHLHPVAAAFLTLGIATFPVAGRAADELTLTPPATPGPRELAGHHFLASHLLEHPFSVTSFAQNFGAGVGEALGPKVEFSPGLNPPTVTPDAQWYGYAGFVEQLDLTVRILEWLSVRAGFSAGIRQGAGDGSALVVGTTATLAGVLGVKGSVQLASNLRASLSLNSSYGPSMNLLLLEGLEQAAREGRISASDFFSSRDALTTNLTAGAAWAPTPWLGVMGNLAWQHTRSATISDVAQDGVIAGASVELDALPLVHWLPVGTGLSYRYTGPIGSGSGAVATVDEYSLGFYYTGRPNLVLGLELEGRLGRIDTELKARQTLAWVDFRYFW